MSEDDLDRVIIEENLKADHRDAKLEELVEKTILDMFYECDFDTDGNANFTYNEEALKDFIRSLLQGKG